MSCGEERVPVRGVELRELGLSRGKGNFMALTCKSIKGLSAAVSLLLMVFGDSRINVSDRNAAPLKARTALP